MTERDIRIRLRHCRRQTETHVSVTDALMELYQCSANQAKSKLKLKAIQPFLSSFTKHKFQGKGQRPTLVGTYAQIAAMVARCKSKLSPLKPPQLTLAHVSSLVHGSMSNEEISSYVPSTCEWETVMQLITKLRECEVVKEKEKHDQKLKQIELSRAQAQAEAEAAELRIKLKLQEAETALAIRRKTKQIEYEEGTLNCKIAKDKLMTTKHALNEVNAATRLLKRTRTLEMATAEAEAYTKRPKVVKCKLSPMDTQKIIAMYFQHQPLTNCTVEGCSNQMHFTRVFFQVNKYVATSANNPNINLKDKLKPICLKHYKEADTDQAVAIELSTPMRIQTWLYRAGNAIQTVCGICKDPEHLVHVYGDWDCSHIYAKSLGGSDELTNMVVGHHKCNREQGQSSLRAYQSAIGVDVTTPAHAITSELALHMQNLISHSRVSAFGELYQRYCE